MRKILLDPGHGEGYNRSEVTPAYAEGTRMWAYSRVLKRKLEEKGYEVFTTRPALSDDPTHYERGTMAGKVGAELFLSLHSNAPSRNPDGSHDEKKTGTVGCYSQGDIAFNRPLTEALTRAVSELMQNPDLGSFYKDYPNRPGVDYYAVLRYASAAGCPRALIIEHGYHTNRSDSLWLSDDGNLELLASAESEVVARFLPPEDGQKLYRVQVGAYRREENAGREERRLKEKGYDSYISFDGEFYRVQAGAFVFWENAEKLAARLRDDGFDVYISYG